MSINKALTLKKCQTMRIQPNRNRRVGRIRDFMAVITNSSRMGLARTGLLLLISVLSLWGCAKPPQETIDGALRATNVVFRTIYGTSIELTDGEAATILSDVSRFKNPRILEVEDQMTMPAFLGSFWLNGVKFGWQGDMLCWHDDKHRRFFIVKDPALGRLFEELNRYAVRGKEKGWAYPPDGEWPKILKVLESK